jgi:hypothetical protein
VSAPRLEPEIRLHLIDVLRALISLLGRFGETERAAWLRERLVVLESDTASAGEANSAAAELHGVVLGMSGLMDMHLRSDSQVASKDANAELRRLADQLYELTR